MIIQGGFYIALLDQRSGRIIFQVSSDLLTEEEFQKLWAMVGNQMRREIISSKPGTNMEFQIRATRAG